MKKTITTTILLLFLSIPLLAQEKRLEQVDDTNFAYKLYDTNGELQQRGFYILIDGELKAHGIWKDSFGTKAYYSAGKIVWIHPNGNKRYSAEDIELHRLKRKVAILEAKLVSL